ncbi:hypothetical protein QNI16_31615 [Cytophagaceae bacterium YF14B1]|uniref:1-deoxy-D-xylulose-5-phosphate synthase n=1 Tax=Xanthocytophaga flava TaxID=3048013 RepID=A0AAE3UCR1_9BACT|nr:hypothetical protein [Xanthocytophaga flavus]MDJ1485089.1 hypothetical protein [Xanthocytophaga flavus]
MKTRIMYIERKAESLTGEARIGKITFSKSGKSLYYNGMHFQRFSGFKANYYESKTEEEYWISGCRKDGADRLYGERLPIEIDKDIQEEYWISIRNLPQCKHISVING